MLHEQADIDMSERLYKARKGKVANAMTILTVEKEQEDYSHAQICSMTAGQTSRLISVGTGSTVN